MHPLFINGYSKSGTSLLVALLDGHPEINVIPEESDYFDGTYFLVEHLLKSNGLGLEEKIEIIYSQITNSTHISNFFKGVNEDDPKGNYDYRSFDTEAFHQVFTDCLNQSGISHQYVFKALATAYAAGTGKSIDKKYWLEKTPYHDLNVSNREELLNSIFSDFKVVHIFRDPRDNYLAYSKKRPELSIYDICYEWKRVSNLALNWKIKDNNLIIRYEDLVLNPEDTMRRILGFLNLKPSDSVYEPTKNGVPWFGNSMFGQKSTKISTDRVYRYKKMLDKKPRDIIESNCIAEMVKLDYIELKQNKKSLSLSYYLAKIKSFYKGQIKKLKIKTSLIYRF